jgi:Ras-related protein Rab-2A
VVQRAEGLKLAKEFDMLYVETSAKSQENIDEAFLRPTLTIVEKIDTGLIDIKKGEFGVKIGGGKQHLPVTGGCEC